MNANPEEELLSTVCLSSNLTKVFPDDSLDFLCHFLAHASLPFMLWLFYKKISGSLNSAVDGTTSM